MYSVKTPEESGGIWQNIEKPENIKRKQNGPYNTKNNGGGECVDKAKDINMNEELKAQEWQVIKLMRELDYGQIVISVKNGKPVHVETRKSITLNP